MLATDVGTRSIPSVRDVDNSLFDYDIGDVFRDVDTNMDVLAVQKPVARADGNENGAGLGIDEEIRMIKKRVPVPKMDENRLLSPAGIPKLRKIATERLKFKGKGHEYSDVARLLNAFQLWLDDLYPRAKFVDGLAIIEKLGHTKRMQTMRREWINERKSQQNWDSLEEMPVSQMKSGQDRSPEVKLSESMRTHTAPLGDEGDVYAATRKYARDDGTQFDGDEEGEVLEGFTKVVPVLGQRRVSPARAEGFDDDEDALLALSGVWC